MNGEGTLVALGTIVRREVTRILRIWSQTLLPPAITMTLYFVIFGSLIGRRIGEMAPGISYIEYIAPGLIMLAISLFFSGIHLYHPFVTLSTFVLAATIFGLLGFINAIYARKFDDI